MIEINKFLKNHHQGIIDIISKFNSEFSSHDFIEKFAQKYEADFIDMLLLYKNKGKAFQTVHSSIARYLSKNKEIFSIAKTERKGSEHVFGSIDKIQWWERIPKHNIEA